MRIENLLNSRRFYLSDGGLETDMIFNKGFELPCFSAAVLLDSEEGRDALHAYYMRFIAIARDTNRGFIIDAPTWRAGTSWSGPMGQTLAETMATNDRAVAFVRAIRDREETAKTPILINGLVGPAGDAYAPDTVLNRAEAKMLHAPQIQRLGKAGVDLISAMTLTHASEAAGIALAARDVDVPLAIAFTLETDGNLPSGQPLEDAIAEVDNASDASPIYYMINCAHPDHFRSTLNSQAAWTGRIGGIRSNASRMSHAELDVAERLDDGDPVELGTLSRELAAQLPNLRVIGGCCGTDHRHVRCMADLEHVHSAA